ncbi:MAG: hypothetical protein DWP98_11200 [Bacteroidetes bacterium]|nr:MAG: hypothetical protein DWP98_11200 [Bacteroidota bacterium]MBL1144203.1 hypothetical protein [Bacteroidota bacterium]MCB0803670.1 hypothetical protein [Flavobacteriales bacterium]NOG56999.1 hypothetical protein [Bacteroidota bacterium]
MDYMPFQTNLEKDDFYLTPEGYRVFTEKYLLKRGYCCKNGCRHCPYGFDKKTGTMKSTK